MTGLRRLNPAYVARGDAVFAVLAEACALAYSGPGDADPARALPFLQTAFSTRTIVVSRSDAARIFALMRMTFCRTR